MTVTCLLHLANASSRDGRPHRTSSAVLSLPPPIGVPFIGEGAFICMSASYSTSLVAAGRLPFIIKQGFLSSHDSAASSDPRRLHPLLYADILAPGLTCLTRARHGARSCPPLKGAANWYIEGGDATARSASVLLCGGTRCLTCLFQC